jgi:hypothetical protein
VHSTSIRWGGLWIWMNVCSAYMDEFDFSRWESIGIQPVMYDCTKWMQKNEWIQKKSCPELGPLRKHLWRRPQSKSERTSCKMWVKNPPLWGSSMKLIKKTSVINWCYHFEKDDPLGISSPWNQNSLWIILFPRQKIPNSYKKGSSSLQMASQSKIDCSAKRRILALANLFY